MTEQITYQYVDFIRHEGELVDAYFEVETATLILCEGLTFQQYKQARLNAERELAEVRGIILPPLGCSASFPLRNDT